MTSTTPVGEAEKPQTLRSPVLPPQHEIDAHSLTHQPFRSWCRVCQQAKGRGGHHQRQHQEESISIIQLDYNLHARPASSTSTFWQTTDLHHPYSPTEPHCRVYHWMMYSSTYLQKEPHSTSSCTTTSLDCEARSFTKSILQSDAETSLTQLVNTVAADLNLPTRASPPYSRQS